IDASGPAVGAAGPAITGRPRPARAPRSARNDHETVSRRTTKARLDAREQAHGQIPGPVAPLDPAHCGWSATCSAPSRVADRHVPDARALRAVMTCPRVIRRPPIAARAAFANRRT